MLKQIVTSSLEKSKRKPIRNQLTPIGFKFIVPPTLEIIDKYWLL